MFLCKLLAVVEKTKFCFCVYLISLADQLYYIHSYSYSINHIHAVKISWKETREFMLPPLPSTRHLLLYPMRIKMVATFRFFVLFYSSYICNNNWQPSFVALAVCTHILLSVSIFILILPFIHSVWLQGVPFYASWFIWARPVQHFVFLPLCTSYMYYVY